MFGELSFGWQSITRLKFVMLDELVDPGNHLLRVLRRTNRLNDLKMRCSGIGHNNLARRGPLIIPIRRGRNEFLPVTVCKLTSSPRQKSETNLQIGAGLLKPKGRARGREGCETDKAEGLG